MEDTGKDMKEIGSKLFGQDLVHNRKERNSMKLDNIGTMGTLGNSRATPGPRETKRRPEDNMEDRAATRCGPMMAKVA
jgi:hypothetical protein